MEEVKEPTVEPNAPKQEPVNNSVTNEDILNYFKQITERLDKLETSKTVEPKIEPVSVEPTKVQSIKNGDMDFDAYCYSRFDKKYKKGSK